MDIPLHPAVSAEIARGQAFIDRIRAARHAIEDARVTVPSPDGDSEVVFGGDGMVVGATFSKDVFDRYPGDQLGALLLAMSEEGYAQVAATVTSAVSAIAETP